MKIFFKSAGRVVLSLLLLLGACKKPDNTVPTPPPPETACSTGYTKVNGKCVVDTNNWFKDEWGGVRPRWMKDSLWWSTSKCTLFDTSYMYINSWDPANPGTRNGWMSSKIEAFYNNSLATGRRCYWPDPVKGDSVEWEMARPGSYLIILNGRFNVEQTVLKGTLRYFPAPNFDPNANPPLPDCGPVEFRKVKEVFD